MSKEKKVIVDLEEYNQLVKKANTNLKDNSIVIDYYYNGYDRITVIPKDHALEKIENIMRIERDRYCTRLEYLQDRIEELENQKPWWVRLRKRIGI